MHQRSAQLGLAPILIVIIVAILAGATLLAVKNYSSNQSKTASKTEQQSTSSAQVEVSPSPVTYPTINPTLTPTLKPAYVPPSAPIIDCLGPDDKHAQATKQDCDNLWKYWATPTPSPTPTPAPQQSSSNNSSSSGNCNTGSASIGISANNGSVVGDAIITVNTKSSSCGSYSSYQILRQGSSSVTFSGLPPGSYNVTANYHGRDFSDSFDVSTDNTASKTVSVSN